ncbi:MAG: hypothetical protein GIX03_14105 [Candidatus Eremiobacteraeota bacterium]|nr:hypothetical protein [Candidatus Eremiobacteraeota bacterium]MBC5804101.1 hypothetical protein [Candidatus Eremiobacteraeota bacterium]MBC5820753.1 hypothetical protein [Candidatus Eremiobacteraeota bacterium]
MVVASSPPKVAQVNDDDQLTTVRELLRDALELARSAGSAAADAGMTSLWQRTRESLRALLGDLDQAASRQR